MPPGNGTKKTSDLKLMAPCAGPQTISRQGSRRRKATDEESLSDKSKLRGLHPRKEKPVDRRTNLIEYSAEARKEARKETRKIVGIGGDRLTKTKH